MLEAYAYRYGHRALLSVLIETRINCRVRFRSQLLSKVYNSLHLYWEEKPEHVFSEYVHSWTKFLAAAGRGKLCNSEGRGFKLNNSSNLTVVLLMHHYSNWRFPSVASFTNHSIRRMRWRSGGHPFSRRRPRTITQRPPASGYTVASCCLKKTVWDPRCKLTAMWREAAFESMGSMAILVVRVAHLRS